MGEVIPDRAAIAALAEGTHGDPFAILGPHGGSIRAFLPAARAVSIVARDNNAVLAAMIRMEGTDFWHAELPAPRPYRFSIDYGSIIYETEDPYSFGPLLGELDLYLLAEGRHRDFARILGAHVVEFEGIHGVRFAVWAPNARRVSVVGGFNGWDGRRHPMRHRFGPGIWEIFIPRLGPGEIYKYEILGPDGAVLPLKADPVAQQTEHPPKTGSIVPDPACYVWHDQNWFDTRAQRQMADAPISIYELHAMSWAGEAHAGNFTWVDLANRLVPYITSIGFTHIELMPVMEHPFGGSWGYQPLGQFSPTARLGPPALFAAFVDICHAAGIGVILDWVPAHFPTDTWGLAQFDGTALYEHADPREGFHQDWNTLIYNHGRNEVRAFLIGSALFWLEQYHVDGLRVDAVASMLYRDYSRKEGQWIPNKYGGRENLEAIEFFHELSAAMLARVPGAMLIAEESTSFPGVSRAVAQGGLGFDYKWNMGWMHDTLNYMEDTPIYRRWHHGDMTFGLVYAFTEKFVLPLSHDEVVYGKKSLIGKMPGDDWQKFANLRAYFGFMWTHPGKKLLFMGGEIAQWEEWNHDAGLDWYLLDRPLHRGMHRLITDLNAAYRNIPALHERDCEAAGFAWVVLDDTDQSVFAYLRFGKDTTKPVLTICNFTPVPRYDYRVGVPQSGAWREVLNTDAGIYGGSNMGNAGQADTQQISSHGYGDSLSLTLPPLATVILRKE